MILTQRDQDLHTRILPHNLFHAFALFEALQRHLYVYCGLDMALANRTDGVVLCSTISSLRIAAYYDILGVYFPHKGYPALAVAS